MKTIAQDIMSTQVLSIREGTPIIEALKLLLTNKITGMPVVDLEGTMIGVLSEYDILKQLSPHLSDRKSMKAELFQCPIDFSRRARSVKTTTSLSFIVKRFVKYKYRRLPVVDETGKLVGIITRKDLMKIFYYRSMLT